MTGSAYAGAAVSIVPTIHSPRAIRVSKRRSRQRHLVPSWGSITVCRCFAALRADPLSHRETRPAKRLVTTAAGGASFAIRATTDRTRSSITLVLARLEGYWRLRCVEEPDTDRYRTNRPRLGEDHERTDDDRQAP